MLQNNYNFVLLSGGIDSTTLLASIIKEVHYPRDLVIAVLVRYPSKHNQLENKAAIKIASHYSVPYFIVDLSGVFTAFDSALLNKDEAIPLGHYQADNMKRTVVPLRNVIFCSTIAGFIISKFPAAERFSLHIGVHSGDHHIYPDCRPKTIAGMYHTLYYGSDGVVHISAPFINLNKHAIVSIGLDINAPYHLTRTCYTSDLHACGECGSCTERLEAFKLCGTRDPIKYKKDEKTR